MLFVPPAVRSYTISADLMRPDGTQELLVGLQGTRAGYALEVRLDQPDALWVSWANGDVVAGAGGTRLNHVAFMPAVQRAVRTVFTGYLFALFFAALALGLYPVLYGAFAATGETAQDDRGRLDAVLHDRRFRWGFFAAVSLAGLVFTALVATNLLQRIPHVQDDVAYLFQAKMFAAGAFNVPAPPIAIQSFFAEQFLPFFEGKWLSQYPPGHPLMLFLGVLVRAPWLVEPVLASLGLACVFLLGRRLYGTGVGVLAALLGLSSPFWLFLGSSFMSHATGMFFFVTFLLCYARAESEEGRVVWPLLAGFLAGMMFITRELTAVGLLAPIAIYTLICFRRWRWALLPALAGVAVPLGLMAVYNWVQMGNPLRSTYFAWDPHFALGFGSHVGPLGPFTPGDGVWNVYQNLSMLSAQLYGWPYGVALALAFLPFALCAARRWDFLLAACFIGVASAHAFYWAPGLMYGPRYYYEALPALFLLTARGAFELGRLPLRIWPSMGLPRDVTLAAFFPAVLLAVLLVFNLRFYLPQQIPLYRGYNFSSNSELQAVQNANIHHAIVFVESPEGRWTDYGNVFFANDPHLDGDIIYARDEGPNDSLLYKYFPGRAHYRLLGTSLTRLSP
jgi:4-amino-4-deoxy-L-arabinose transferase-like glycosyltransferase